MSAYLHQIATCEPPHRYEQRDTAERMRGWARAEKTRRGIDAVHRRSGIATRYSVSADFRPGVVGELFASDEAGALRAPGTAQRNRVYARWARELSVGAAREALAANPWISPEEVTHVILVSCTGFVNPGPDFHIVNELGLRPSVQRYSLGFMGCHAALPALRLAAQCCAADPAAVVLVVCVELCTLHVQPDETPDQILANALFADGAGAALVASRPPPTGRTAFRLDGFSTTLVAGSENRMAWEIGDTGFNLVLSSYVPDVLGENLAGLVGNALRKNDLSPANIDAWAAHPGGRAILDKIEDSLDLGRGALTFSRQVLRDFGNMSSATMLYVLRDMLAADMADGARVCALAFGPGLTVETALMRKVLSP